MLSQYQVEIGIVAVILVVTVLVVALFFSKELIEKTNLQSVTSTKRRGMAEPVRMLIEIRLERHCVV